MPQKVDLATAAQLHLVSLQVFTASQEAIDRSACPILPSQVSPNPPMAYSTNLTFDAYIYIVNPLCESGFDMNWWLSNLIAGMTVSADDVSLPNHRSHSDPT